MPALRQAIADAGQMTDETEQALLVIEGGSKDGGFLPIEFREGGAYFLGRRVAEVPAADFLASVIN